MDNTSEQAPTRAGWLSVSRVLPRASTNSCHPKPDIDLCEKPTISSTKTFIILIVMGAIFVSIFLALLTFLHFRRRRLDAAENAKDLQELDDYGLAPARPPQVQSSQMPQMPPPTKSDYFPPHMHGENELQRAPDRQRRDRRVSEDSLSPSLRQAMGVVPHDALANK